MPLSFPPSPAIDDEYAFGGLSWVFNGTGWARVAPVSQSGFFVGAEVLWKEALVTNGLEGIVVNSLATELTYI
jgi:hypothetical protein